MSVFTLSADEFGSIIRTLRHHRLFPLSWEEACDYQTLLATKESREDYALPLMEQFVFRCYLANQLAEEYTYLRPGHANIVIPVIRFPPGAVLSMRELLRTLTCLAYNVTTNGGNSFLGRKDGEKLRTLIADLSSRIIAGEDRSSPLQGTPVDGIGGRATIAA